MKVMFDFEMIYCIIFHFVDLSLYGNYIIYKQTAGSVKRWQCKLFSVEPSQKSL